MKYRQEIDGLRALAILPVVFFHAGIQAFSGGFVGVDIFFVISGYLITSILAAEHTAGSFSLVGFYERRVRRILPALFVVVAASIPFAWVFLLPPELQGFSRSVVAVPLFVSNFFFWKDGNYFEEAAELKPLLHTWSLAVEEQYYVFFPLLLAAVWKFGRHAIVLVMAALIVGSLLLAERALSHDPGAAFFLAPTRIWELALGGLVALSYPRLAATRGQRLILGNALSMLGLGLILIAIFAFSKSTPVPGLWALIPTIGSALIIAYASSQTLAGRLLGCRPLVGVGLISYSAYLWDQPLFAFARSYYGHIHTAGALIMSAAAFLLAAVTWRYVETPFRDKSNFSRRKVFTAVLLFGGILIFVGLSTSYVLRSNPKFQVENALAESLAKGKTVYAQNVDERLLIKSRIEAEIARPDIVVAGSSRVMQIGEQALPGRVLNLGVSGASIEDIVSILDMATEALGPKTLLIGLDPWLLNRNSGQRRWLALKSEYELAARKLRPESMTPGLEKEALFVGKDRSGESLGDSLYFLYKSVNTRSLVADNDSVEYKHKIRPDGRRVYNLAYTTKGQDEMARGFSQLMDYSMKRYELSEENLRLLGSMIRHYKTQNHIVLVLAPYHPDMYDRLKKEFPLYLEIEAIFRKVASEQGVNIVGSYDPSLVGCKEADFFDGIHPNDFCMKKVLQRLADEHITQIVVSPTFRATTKEGLQKSAL